MNGESKKWNLESVKRVVDEMYEDPTWNFREKPKSRVVPSVVARMVQVTELFAGNNDLPYNHPRLMRSEDEIRAANEVIKRAFQLPSVIKAKDLDSHTYDEFRNYIDTLWDIYETPSDRIMFKP